MKTRGIREDKVNIITMGCSKNTVDSEVLLTQLRAQSIDAAHQDTAEDANIIIINTCGFIEQAKQESIDTILRFAEARAQGAIEKLYVTGCLSQRYRDALSAEIPEVDAWFGTLELPAILARFGADYKHALLGERKLSTPAHYAYLKISEGCNRTCAFCAIPLMRGKHVSRPADEIVAEAEGLAARGVKEIILIAQELTYYGLDIYHKRALPDLLQRLNAVEGIAWIRLHYAYPSHFPLELADAMRACDKVCRYLDLPLQHASDRMLQRMHRQISKQETITLLENLRERIPGLAIRTTMLTGFPGETEEDVAELLDFIRVMRFDRLGVFTYSHEEGTDAFRFDDDVSAAEKERRASLIMEAQEEIAVQKNSDMVGTVQNVLFDRLEGGFFVGRTEFDSPEVDNEVLVDASKHYLRTGDFARIRITDANAFDLYGEPVLDHAQ